MPAKTLFEFKEEFRKEYGVPPTESDIWFAGMRAAESLKPSHNSASTKLLAALHEAVLHSFSGDAYTKTDLYNEVREQLRASGAPVVQNSQVRARL